MAGFVDCIGKVNKLNGPYIGLRTSCRAPIEPLSKPLIEVHVVIFVVILFMVGSKVRECSTNGVSMFDSIFTWNLECFYKS